ncbi:hypothetical protein M5X00_24190 [Paenibacillus alvei]|uniref:Uncharacterized protein n=1 Tax=Paenibacillus alvei TaxID=44250 RepID=A0ABT4GR38_PAEAL|nr:hypothetical protein [Paenibacillus alvei]MCY9757330.1 hypothetical protein [Paenibacillus alvei]MCY9759139.1 hypothetical protein [Paenibacillus alvei]MCY9770402.1 hypothetical protein [Paenibacillus alvei]
MSNEITSLLKKFDIPTLSQDTKGKTILKQLGNILLFTDYTCVLLSEYDFIHDHDDISLKAYLDVWSKHLPENVLKLKESINWIDRTDLLRVIEGLPDNTDYQDIIKYITENHQQSKQRMS